MSKETRPGSGHGTAAEAGHGPDFDRKRYLVTGGCGFIGSHLVRALAAKAHRVTVLDNLSTGRRENLPPGVTLIVGDISDRDAVETAMAEVDGIFHLAAVASVERSTADWVESHRTNLTGTVTLLDTARKARPARRIPVVYASSAAVYGNTSKSPLSEADATVPASAYGADKLACEHQARVASLVHGVPTIGLRIFNAYGPRANASSPYSGVISVFADRLARGRTLPILGDGMQLRDFIHVSDIVLFLMRAMLLADDQARVVNLCTGRATSILALARLLAKISGVTPKLEFGSPRPGDVRSLVGDPSRSAVFFGLEAAIPLRRGLAALLEAAPLSTVA